jgi:membrane associated rhomboid family serine protease
MQFGQLPFQFPRPGKALLGVMTGLFLLWLTFAIAVNWGGASADVFFLFCGNSELILQGEVWRLVTAAFMHFPTGSIGHILFVLMGLYFLTPALEERWGGPRLLRFLFFSAIIAYSVQFLVGLLLPATASAKLVPQYWFGAFPVLEAVAIAWAFSFRFVVAMSVLRVIAVAEAPEGLLSPFGGMLAGWLLGGGTPSPLRKAYLMLRLRQLDREAEAGRAARKDRVKNSRFEVIDGGKKGSRGPDGKWLN